MMYGGLVGAILVVAWFSGGSTVVRNYAAHQAAQVPCQNMTYKECAVRLINALPDEEAKQLVIRSGLLRSKREQLALARRVAARQARRGKLPVANSLPEPIQDILPPNNNNGSEGNNGNGNNPPNIDTPPPVSSPPVDDGGNDILNPPDIDVDDLPEEVKDILEVTDQIDNIKDDTQDQIDGIRKDLPEIEPLDPTINQGTDMLNGAIDKTIDNVKGLIK